MVEPPVSYLESTVPAAASERAISVGSAGRDCFARRVLSLRPPSTVLRYFLRTTTVMGRKKITGDELNARAKTNGYKRGHPGKKTAVETATSTSTTPRK